MSQSSLFTPTIVLITGHLPNSAKFCGNVEIPRQKGKFRGSARNSVACWP